MEPDDNAVFIEEFVIRELLLNKDQWLFIVDNPVLPAEYWFVPGQRKNPHRFF